MKILWRIILSVSFILIMFLLLEIITSAQTGVTVGNGVTVNSGTTIGGAPAASFTPAFSTAGNCRGPAALTCTVTLSVTPGQFVACGIGSTDATAVLSCSDSDGDTITNQPTSNPYINVGAAWTLGLFEGVLTHTNASEIFTCTRTTTSFVLDCAIAVYSGVPTSGWDVALAGLSTNGLGSGITTLSSGTTTATTNASELAIGFFMVNTSASVATTQSGSWNIRTNSTNNVSFTLVDQTLTVTGAQTASIVVNNGSTGNDAAGIISTVK